MYEYIKILLVEDETPLLGAMSLKLKKAGFTVLQALNGKQGLDIAMKEYPNIIITDIVMPEMDGLQMIQNIRQDQQWGANVPIILLTNLNDFNHVATAMEYGVHDYLVKSNWKLKDLLETVKSKLSLSKDAPPQPTQNNNQTTTNTQEVGQNIQTEQPQNQDNQTAAVQNPISNTTMPESNQQQFDPNLIPKPPSPPQNFETNTSGQPNTINQNSQTGDQQSNNETQSNQPEDQKGKSNNYYS